MSWLLQGDPVKLEEKVGYQPVGGTRADSGGLAVG